MGAALYGKAQIFLAAVFSVVWLSWLKSLKTKDPPVTHTLAPFVEAALTDPHVATMTCKRVSLSFTDAAFRHFVLLLKPLLNLWAGRHLHLGPRR